MSINNLREVVVTRYLQPLREGGSLPAITEADDGFMYVLKFKGAGQGTKALIAELIGGEIARKLGLKVPELVIATVDVSFGRSEPDEEIQDLLKASTGKNLGLHYLSGAITFDPIANKPDPYLCSKIVWLDAYLFNVDRTVRNTNMLMWKNELWLIDHGAALYFHHSWDNWKEYIDKKFGQLKDHVLIDQAKYLKEVDQEHKKLLQEKDIIKIVSMIPEEWLTTFQPEISNEDKKSVYTEFLTQRLKHSSVFINS